MKMLKNIILATTILVLGCVAAEGQGARAQAPGLREAENAGVSFLYSADDFDEVKVERGQKQTAQDVGDGVPFGVMPEHFCFNLKDKRPLPSLERGGRYFYPADSFVCAIPLGDASVEDFGAAYPGLHKAASTLRRMLRARPRRVRNRDDVPDIPYNNASPSLISRFQYLDFRSGSGILFLTQYSQEMEPNPVNNEELTLNFQGVTKDGRYYIAARLAITHPSLPRGIDFTDQIKRDGRNLYLRRAERALEQLPEESFRPSLKRLKALLSSVSVR